ncbi:MAG: hypothetical protein MZV70_12960 [Desulfobacterales bacterium]|nr:hypothetical protein [Desulfobacterales bacterium]
MAPRPQGAGACGVSSVVGGFVTALDHGGRLRRATLPGASCLGGRARGAGSRSATPVLGQLQFVLKERRAEIRKIHRWAGAIDADPHFPQHPLRIALAGSSPT